MTTLVYSHTQADAVVILWWREPWQAVKVFILEGLSIAIGVRSSENKGIKRSKAYHSDCNFYY